MCGINGFTGNSKQKIVAMNEATKHRGPDGMGHFVNDDVSLGHNLLAITDQPDRSRQPIHSYDGRFALVYNGEIYNYRKLRAELIDKGDSFVTNSDTEVMLNGLARYGESFLSRLDGMFAIALYDKIERTLLLARDSAGMKSLYYFHQGNDFVFSSELRGLFAYGIDRKLDLDAAKIYFVLGYVPGYKTMVRNVRKVMPGQCVRFDFFKQTMTQHWIKDEIALNDKRCTLNDFMHTSAVRHTMGLRPFGLYLSGGLDSTVILHELSQEIPEKINTYTTRFDTKDSALNEDADRAQQLTKDYNINHHEILVTEKNFIDATQATIETLEEPRYNFSVPAYWLLAKRASQDVTVVLNGSGGDELFLGYDRYVESQKLSQRFAKYPNMLVDLWHTASALKKRHVRLGQSVKLNKSYDRWAYLNRFMPKLDRALFPQFGGFDYLDVASYIASLNYPRAGALGDDPENTIARLDRMLWLADEEFMRTDKIAMHFGMEGRFPFLARDIVRYAESLSSKEKLKNGITKSAVREAYKNKLPGYIIRKRKTGWYAPVVEWMSGEYGDFARDVISHDYYGETNAIIDFDVLQKEIHNTAHVSRVTIKKYMLIFAFNIWARRFSIKI